MSIGFALWALALAVLGGTILEAQPREGYQLLSDQVLVHKPEHWQAWEAAEGARVIHPDGTVEPSLLRRQINAALNAADFDYVSEGDTLVGGIFAAGTNQEAAALVIDGDMETYWEPAGEDLASWFVEIDLARAVIAERIVVRFVEQGQGDPFLKFRVLISDGRKVATQTRIREYFRVGLVTQLNKDQREFVFPVQSQKPVSAGTAGEITQLVRIEVLGTDGPRGREVGLEDYQSLPAGEQGAVDHFRQTVAGRQIRVKKEIYEILPAAEQGAIRYYRRERPRLAEVEVYTLGDNVVRLTRRPQTRGAVTSAFLFARTFSDGKYSTFQSMAEYDPVQNKNQLEVDLGAKYWLDRIRLLSPSAPPPAYQVRIADGSLDPSGRKIWRSFDERQNKEGFLQVEELFPLREVRFIEVRRLKLLADSKEIGNLSEVQAYGEGYVSEVVMTSPMIALHRSRLFSTLEWEGEAPPNTRIEVRTRSGDELILIPHYFHPNGAEINKKSWERLDEEERPPVEIEELPGADWSFWSAAYRESGEAFKSPSPRSYALVQVKLIGEESLRAARIRQLKLNFGAPLVDQVYAEIWPLHQIAVGEEEEFTLYIRPNFGSGNPGWDRLRLRSSSAAPIEPIAVHAGQDGSLRQGTARQLWPGGMQIERGEEGEMLLIFSEPVTGGETIYAIKFRTRVFLSNTLFSAELSRQTRPGVIQAVTEGEASTLVESQSLVAHADLGDAALLGDMAVLPPVFTPNGDGVNDVAQIYFVVSVIEGAKRLQVAIYDLAGRRVRNLALQRTRPSGAHLIHWDGRDGSGKLLPPGSYVVRVGLNTDRPVGDTSALRLVQMVY
jgi:hypothetical protein